jgi:hypothetical protein
LKVHNLNFKFGSRLIEKGCVEQEIWLGITLAKIKVRRYWKSEKKNKMVLLLTEHRGQGPHICKTVMGLC